MSSRRRKPEWLKSRPPSGERFAEIKETLRDRNLHTVCEEANCPNLGDCWSGRNGPGTATFMLMGDRCSRGCNFCDVETGGMEALDPDEPENVAEAVADPLCDDDLGPDGGGHHHAVEARDQREVQPDGGDLGLAQPAEPEGVDELVEDLDQILDDERQGQDDERGGYRAVRDVVRRDVQPSHRILRVARTAKYLRA